MNTNTHKGFVILIAVLVGSLMVSLGAFIAGIAVKELALSSSGRESQRAFYAADSALECALYQDFRVRAFASSTDDVTGPGSVGCNNQAWAVSFGLRDTSSTESFFEISFNEPGESEDLAPYALVRIYKENIGTINDRTVIESRGFNIKDATSPKRVERSLQVLY